MEERRRAESGAGRGKHGELAGRRGCGCGYGGTGRSRGKSCASGGRKSLSWARVGGRKASSPFASCSPPTLLGTAGVALRLDTARELRPRELGLRSFNPRALAFERGTGLLQPSSPVRCANLPSLSTSRGRLQGRLRYSLHTRKSLPTVQLVVPPFTLLVRPPSPHPPGLQRADEQLSQPSPRSSSTMIDPAIFFPPEIVARIAELVSEEPPAARLPVLLSLSSASRSWHLAVQKPLYRSIRLSSRAQASSFVASMSTKSARPASVEAVSLVPQAGAWCEMIALHCKNVRAVEYKDEGSIDMFPEMQPYPIFQFLGAPSQVPLVMSSG